MRVNLNTINNKYQPKQTPIQKMQTHRLSQVQHLREYIVAIQNQLKSFDTQRKTLLQQLSKFQNANNNMRLEIDYLVTQLKGLDVIIDEKNGDMQKLEREVGSSKEQLKQMREALQQKVLEVQELNQTIKELQANSSRASRSTRMDREIQEIKLRSQVQQQLQPKIQSLAQQIHTLKLQLSQKDFSYTNLQKTLILKAHSLNEKDQLIATNTSQIQLLRAQVDELKNIKHSYQRETQQLKHLLQAAEQNCHELRGDDSIKKEIINQQQRVVLVENLSLKKEKQLLVTHLEQLKSLNEQLVRVNTSLKEECMHIQGINSQITNENSVIKVQLQQMRNKLLLVQNSSTNLTHQNHTLRQQNLRLNSTNEQLEKSLQQLKNYKQLPKSQYESLKAKLQCRLQQVTQKQQQLKKRHWLQIARYANQIDKLKTDIQQKNKQNNQLKKQIKQQHNNFTTQEIANQSSVIILQAEKQSIRIQLGHEWKEKVDQEALQLQQSINRLKTQLQQEINTVSKLRDDLKLKQQLINEKNSSLLNKQRQISALNKEITNLTQDINTLKGKLNQSQQSLKEQSFNIKSLQLQLKSKDQTISLRQSQINSLNQQLQQKTTIITQKDTQITNKQTIINFKDDQLIRKQNNFQLEKQIMNNILQTQIKQGMQQKQQHLKKTLLTSEELNNIRKLIKHELQQEMEENYQTMRENLINQIQQDTFKKLYNQYEADITKRVQAQTQNRLRKSLYPQIRQQLLKQLTLNPINNFKTTQYQDQRSNSREQNTQLKQFKSQQLIINNINHIQSVQQLQKLGKYHREQSQRDKQLYCLRQKFQQNMRACQSLVKSLNESELHSQRQNQQIKLLKFMIEDFRNKKSSITSTSGVQNQMITHYMQEISRQKQQFNLAINEVITQKTKLKQQIDQKQLINNKLRQQINKNQLTNNKLRQQINQHQLTNNKLQQQYIKLKQSISQYQLKCLQLQQKSLELQHQLEKIQKLLDDSHQQLKSQRTLNIQLENQLLQTKSTLKKTIHSGNNPNDLSNNQNNNNKQLQEKLLKYQQQQSQHLQEVNSLKIQLQNITNELIESDSLRAQLNKKIQTLNKQITIKNAEIKQLREFKQVKQNQSQKLISNQQPKHHQGKQIKEQKQFNQQNYLLKIKHLQQSLKTQSAKLQMIINQSTQKLKHQQNLIHEKQLQYETLQSQLKTKLDEMQQLQELITLKDQQIQLKDQEIHQLTLKANALQIKYNNYFGQIIKRNKQQEEINIFNKKKITHLLTELQQTKKIIADYQRSFTKCNQTIHTLQNQLLQKDAKIQSLQRQAQRTKKYQQIINPKPQTLRESPKEQPPQQLQTKPFIPPLIIQQKNLSNYQKIMKKQHPKPMHSQQLSLKPQQQQSESFRRPQQSIMFPQKASDRFNQQHNGKMISLFNNNNSIPTQFSPYSIGKIPGPNFFNNPPHTFTFSQKNHDSMNSSEYEQDYNQYIEQQHSFQHNQQDASSPNNFFNPQYTFYKPNQNMSIVSQDNNHQNYSSKSPIRFGQALEQKLIEKNKALMEKSKSEKLLKNPNNVAKSIKDELNQVTTKITATTPSTPISTTNHPTITHKITTQKPINLQQKQKQPKSQTQKKPQQKNGGIRKNITQQNQKILNISHQRINSKDMQRKTSDDMELHLLGDTKSKSKLIRTMKSQSEMVKGQVGIVSNLK